MSPEIDSVVTPRQQNESDWVRAVASLIRLTEEGKVKWKSAPPPKYLQQEPEQRVDAVFTAEYEEKRLRLYVRVKRVEDPNPFIALGPFKKRYPYWTREVVLELGDKAERGWYAIPESDALEELLESVKYQVLGVDEFLDRILDADNQSEELNSM